MTPRTPGSGTPHDPMSHPSHPQDSAAGAHDAPLDRVVAECTERQCREQLSALLDGALPAQEARFLLRRLQHDHALAGHWERWQVYGDALRGSAPALLPTDFAQRVAAALAAEAGAQEQLAVVGGNAPVATRPRWLRWGGGAALAASVAVAALFVVQRAPIQDGTGPGGATRALELASSSGAGADPLRSAGAVYADPAAQGRGAAGAATAAIVLAAAEVPRRTARRERQAQSRVAAAIAPSQVAAAGEPATVPGTAAGFTVASAVGLNVASSDSMTPGAAASGQTASPADPFAGDGSLVARPWPRAVLPVLSERALTVDYGTVDQSHASSPIEVPAQYAPFAPQLPVDAPQAPDARP